MHLAKDDGTIRGVQASRYGPQISHLLFADNSIMFGEASISGAMKLKGILKEYERGSGQSVNFHKSRVFYSSNTKQDVKQPHFEYFGC